MLTDTQLESIPLLSIAGYSAMDFLHGNCGFFALALHDVFGYEIEKVVEYDEDDEDEDALTEHLVHIYCCAGDEFIDVRGRTKDEDAFFDEFDDWLSSNDDTVEQAPVDPEMIRAMVEADPNGDDCSRLYHEARKIIESRKEIYDTRAAV